MAKAATTAAGGTEGKTQKDGLTSLSIKRGDNTVQVIFKGEKGAIKMGDEEWKSLSDPAQGDAQQGPGRFIAGMVRGFKTPAAQAESVLEKVQDLQKADDAYSAPLTEEGAKELLTLGRRRNPNAGNDNNAPQVSNAKGSVKIWTKDGQASKIQYTVQGTVSRNGQDREVNRTTTVEITEVGNTKVEVPAEAKEKAQIP